MPEKPKTLDDAVVQTLYLKGKSAAVVIVAEEQAEVAAIHVCQDPIMEMLQLLVEHLDASAVTPVRERNPPGSRQGSSEAQLCVTSVERKANLRGDVLLAANLDHGELDTLLSAVERATEGNHLQCQNQGWFTTSLLVVNPVCAYHVVGSIYGLLCALCWIRGRL